MSETPFQARNGRVPTARCPLGRPGKFASHAGLAEGRFDENEPTFGNGSDEGTKGLPTLGVLGSVSLYRDEGLFWE